MINICRVYAIYLVLAAIFAVILTFAHRFLKTPHPFWNSLKSILSSSLAMGVLNYLSALTGIPVAINVLSLCAAWLLGIPGVALLTILNTVF